MRAIGKSALAQLPHLYKKYIARVQRIKHMPLATKQPFAPQVTSSHILQLTLPLSLPLKLIRKFNPGVKGGKGPASSLFIDNIAKPTPAASQVVAKVRAFGLNRMDLLQREGLYPLPPQAPETMGVEFSGVVESLGADAGTDFKVGDEVFGLAYGGLFALIFCY